MRATEISMVELGLFFAAMIALVVCGCVATRAPKKPSKDRAGARLNAAGRRPGGWRRWCDSGRRYFSPETAPHTAATCYGPRLHAKHRAAVIHHLPWSFREL